MNHILLERNFDPTLSPGDFAQMIDNAAECAPLYRVEWRESLLALDGSRLLCSFSAPDTESVRQVGKDPRCQTMQAWPGTFHDTGRDLPANVVVSRSFDEPVTVESLQAIEDAAAACLEMRRVTFLRTYFSTDCKRMLCLYYAPDAESAREAQREAGMPFDAVWAGQHYNPQNLPIT